MYFFDITEFGASHKENVINTKAIQAAVDACYEVGGGTVYCPSGTFYTVTIWLKSNVTLYLENGCTLKACTDLSEYNSIDCFFEHDVIPHQNADGTHLIIAYKQKNVKISGEGCIDGNSEEFFTCGKFEHPNFPEEYIKGRPLMDDFMENFFKKTI